MVALRVIALSAFSVFVQNTPEDEITQTLKEIGVLDSKGRIADNFSPLCNRCSCSPQNVGALVGMLFENKERYDRKWKWWFGTPEELLQEDRNRVAHVMRNWNPVITDFFFEGMLRRSRTEAAALEHSLRKIKEFHDS